VHAVVPGRSSRSLDRPLELLRGIYVAGLAGEPSGQRFHFGHQLISATRPAAVEMLRQVCGSKR